MTTIKLHRNDKQVARIASEVKRYGYFNWGDNQFKVKEFSSDIPYVVFKCELVEWAI